jgi:hypothetical protein
MNPSCQLAAFEHCSLPCSDIAEGHCFYMDWTPPQGYRSRIPTRWRDR